MLYSSKFNQTLDIFIKPFNKALSIDQNCLSNTFSCLSQFDFHWYPLAFENVFWLTHLIWKLIILKKGSKRRGQFSSIVIGLFLIRIHHRTVLLLQSDPSIITKIFWRCYVSTISWTGKDFNPLVIYLLLNFLCNMRICIISLFPSTVK